MSTSPAACLVSFFSVILNAANLLPTWVSFFPYGFFFGTPVLAPTLLFDPPRGFPHLASFRVVRFITKLISLLLK